MRCKAAELELSARADGTRDPSLDRALDEHLESCTACRSFRDGIGGLRASVRLEPAVEVPGHLATRIVEAVRDERLRKRRSVRHPSLRGWVRPAAAFLAGAAASTIALGGLPVLRRGVPSALANEIPALVAKASFDVEAYKATFEIVESNYREEIPERRFEADVGFRSPERFEAEITDLTEYPPGRWIRNEISLVVDGGHWEVSGPATCPRASLPTCGTGARETRSVRGREPFDGDTPLPSDVVVPVRTLALRDRVEVSAVRPVLGRNVVGVTLPFRDAVSLFAFLHQAGSWRPFFPLDPVTISLDRQTWLPLAWEVRAAGSGERDRWAAQSDLPSERPGQLLFGARVRSFELDATTEPAAAAVGGRDAGFLDVGFDRLAEVTGYEPLLPSELAGLRPHRAGVITRGGRSEVVLAYARGLAWLKVRQTPHWDQPALYGNVSSLAAPIRLGDGVAYGEPATVALGRRLSIHTKEWDVFLESNLSDALLMAAASLPVTGQEAPATWLVRRWLGDVVREQVTLDRAAALAPYLLVPTSLGDDYDVTVHMVRASEREGVTLFFRREMEPDGIGVKLHLAPGAGLPPPLDPETFAVRVAGALGRYTPERDEIEWVADGMYRSLSAHGLDLAHLVEIARSLAPPR